MALKKITDLAALPSADANDLIEIADISASLPKKVTLAGIFNAVVAAASITAAKIDFTSFLQLKGAAGSSSAFSDGGYNDLGVSPATGTAVSMSVTVPPSGKVALMWSAGIFNATNDNQTFVAYAATGANTIAAADANALKAKILGGSSDSSYARVKMLTGLTPGATTFKLQRRNTTGNVTISDANLIAIPVYE